MDAEIRDGLGCARRTLSGCYAVRLAPVAVAAASLGPLACKALWCSHLYGDDGYHKRLKGVRGTAVEPGA